MKRARFAQPILVTASVAAAGIVAALAATSFATFLLGFVGVLVAAALVTVGARRELSGPTVRPLSLPLAYGIGLFMSMVVAAVPSIIDPSFLLVSSVEYYPHAFFAVGVSFAAYFAGAHVGRLRVRRARPSIPAVVRTTRLTRRNDRRVHIALLASFALVFAFVWGMRFYLAREGYFSAWYSEREELADDSRFASYALKSLRWTLIPFIEYFRVKARSRRARLFWTCLSLLEVASYVIANERRAVVVAAVQLGLARASFERWTTKRLAGIGAAFAIVFFLVINPAVYLMRQEINAGVGAGANQLVAYPTLFAKGVARRLSGESAEYVAGRADRDLKYRLNTLYYLAAVIGSDLHGRCEHGWGSYTIRNAATIVPAFLWDGKRDFAISNVKLELAGKFGVPYVDYVQTLPVHAYGDAAWLGLIIVMGVAGAFDARVWKWMAERWHYGAIRVFYFALLPTFLSPVEDFAKHFLLKFRETAPIFVALFLLEWFLRRRERAALRAPSPRTLVAPYGGRAVGGGMPSR